MTPANLRAWELSVAIIVIFERPGMTRAMYEEVATMLTGARGLVSKPSDWPVPGLISHAAGPTEDGWIIIDVWESEEDYLRFREVIKPLLRSVGAPEGELQGRVYPVFNLVTS